MTDDAAFVGREHELAELLVHAGRAAAGHGGLTFVRGEPGVGKTALAEQAVAAAGGLGFAVHWGTGIEGDEQPPFWVWTQVLRTVLPALDDDDLRRELGPSHSELGLLIPEFVTPATRNTAADAQAQFVLYDAITRTLLAASRRCPILLVLDDLHLADRSSLRCLAFLARQLRDARILVVGTHRDVDVDADSAWAGTAPDLARVGRAIELGGLSLDEIATLLDQIVPERGTAAVVAEVLRDSGGNPLFARQVVRLIAAEGSVTRVPGNLREVLLRRFARFGEQTRGVLRAAAVMGTTVDVKELAAVCDLPGHDVLDRLEEPIAARILELHGGVNGRLSFSHGLMRKLVLDELPAGTRIRLHLRAAEALERLQLADPAPYLARLAGHYVEAAALGDVEPAIRYSRAAAAQASASYAYDDALRHLTTVRRLLESQPMTSLDRLVEAVLDVADVQARAEGPPVASRTYHEALEMADRSGTPRLYARAALGCCIDGTTGYHARPDLIALLRQALERLPAHERSARSAVLAELAELIAVFDDGFEKASAAAGEAVRTARESGDDMTLSRALLAQLHVDWAPHTLDQRVAIVAELGEVARRRGDDEMSMHARLNAFGHAIEAADRAAANVLLEQVVRSADLLHTPRWTMRKLTSQASMAVVDGDFHRARQVIAKATLLSERAPTLEATLAVIHMRAQLFGDLAEPGDADVAERIRVLASQHGHHIWSMAALTLSHVDRRDDARDALHRGLEVVSTYRNRRALLTSAVRLSEVAVRLDETAAARNLYSVLLPYGDKIAVVGDGWAVLGPVALALGRLAAYLGDPAAERHLVQADEVSARIGARAWPLRIQVVRARLHATTAMTADVRRLAVARGLTRAQRDLDTPPSGTPATRDVIVAGRPRAFLDRQGDQWTVGWGNATTRMKDTKGLNYLAALVRDPGVERHVLDLVTTIEHDAGHQRHALHDAGPLLDARAKSAYKVRLTALREDLEEAELVGADDTAASISAEIDALTAELARAVGLGGRDRKAASAAEKARLNVTRAVRATIARIAEAFPPLGEHLSTAVRTGTYCAYEPETGTRVTVGGGVFSHR